MCPLGTLGGILREFQLAFPRWNCGCTSKGWARWRNCAAGGPGGTGGCRPDEAEGQPLDLARLGEVLLAPVAAPFHPLARMDTIAPGSARQYRQLVLTDRSPLTAGRDFGVFGNRTWKTGRSGCETCAAAGRESGGATCPGTWFPPISMPAGWWC